MAGLGPWFSLRDCIAVGFVPSQDFTDGRFTSVTRSHGRSAFSDYRLCFVIRFQRRQEIGSLYEIAKAVGFVPSRDFTDGWFSSVTRSHGQSAFSGCRLCSVMRFQRRQVLVFLYNIARAAGFVSS